MKWGVGGVSGGEGEAIYSNIDIGKVANLLPLKVSWYTLTSITAVIRAEICDCSKWPLGVGMKTDLR